MNWKEYSLIVRSKERKQIFSALVNPRTPTEIARGLKKSVPQISRTLKLFVDNGLVECKTPEMRKGRIYALTKKGEKLLEQFKKEI